MPASLSDLVNWIQEARANKPPLLGDSFAPSLGTAFAASAMKGGAPSPEGLQGLYNATAPSMGKSLSEMGLRFPESTVQTHVSRAPAPRPMTEPIDAVKAADGMSGDAAEALINRLMGIGAK